MTLTISKHRYHRFIFRTNHTSWGAYRATNLYFPDIFPVTFDTSHMRHSFMLSVPCPCKWQPMKWCRGRETLNTVLYHLFALLNITRKIYGNEIGQGRSSSPLAGVLKTWPRGQIWPLARPLWSEGKPVFLRRQVKLCSLHLQRKFWELVRLILSLCRKVLMNGLKIIPSLC